MIDNKNEHYINGKWVDCKSAILRQEMQPEIKSSQKTKKSKKNKGQGMGSQPGGSGGYNNSKYSSSPVLSNQYSAPYSLHHSSKGGGQKYQYDYYYEDQPQNDYQYYQHPNYKQYHGYQNDAEHPKHFSHQVAKKPSSYSHHHKYGMQHNEQSESRNRQPGLMNVHPVGGGEQQPQKLSISQNSQPVPPNVSSSQQPRLQVGSRSSDRMSSQGYQTMKPTNALPVELDNNHYDQNELSHSGSYGNQMHHTNQNPLPIPKSDSPTNYHPFGGFQQHQVQRIPMIGGFYTPQAQNLGRTKLYQGENTSSNSKRLPPEVRFMTPSSKLQTPQPQTGFSQYIETVTRTEQQPQVRDIEEDYDS